MRVVDGSWTYRKFLTLEKWPDISDAISKAFNDVITGKASPETAAREAGIQVESILEISTF